MKKDPKVFIEHILECVERIEEYTGNALLETENCGIRV
jgi:uncharacterized protein with HEPN domain